MTDIDAQFHELDTNRDGKLSWHECLAFFAKSGVSHADATRIFAKVDFDKNGVLDKAEFRRLHKFIKQEWLLAPYPRESKTGGSEAVSLFNSLDTNNDGMLSWTEVMAYFESRGVTAAKAKDIFDAFDKDKNGSLDLAEFRKLYKRLQQGWHLGGYPRAETAAAKPSKLGSKASRPSRPAPLPLLDRLLRDSATRHAAMLIVLGITAKIAWTAMRS